MTTKPPPRVEDVGEISDHVGEYLDDDPHHRRIERKADRAMQLANEAKAEADALRARIDAAENGMKKYATEVRSHLDRVTGEQNKKIDRGVRDGKRNTRLLQKVLRDQKSGALERSHQLKALGMKVPIYTAVIGGIVAVLTAFFVSRAGGLPAHPASDPPALSPGR